MWIGLLALLAAVVGQRASYANPYPSTTVLDRDSAGEYPDRLQDRDRNTALVSQCLRRQLSQRDEAFKNRGKAHARNLLAQPGVVAVGIGGGSTPDTAALKVYITEDTPQIRSAVASEVGSEESVSFRVIGGRFKAL